MPSPADPTYLVGKRFPKVTEKGGSRTSVPKHGTLGFEQPPPLSGVLPKHPLGLLKSCRVRTQSACLGNAPALLIADAALEPLRPHRSPLATKRDPKTSPQLPRAPQKPSTRLAAKGLWEASRSDLLPGTQLNGEGAPAGVHLEGGELATRSWPAAVLAVDEELPDLLSHSDVVHHHRQLGVLHRALLCGKKRAG